MGKWMENFVLPRMPVCGICVSYFHNPGVYGRFYGLNFFIIIILRKWLSWKLSIDALDSSMMKKTFADLKAKGKKPESTRPAWSIVVMERMLENA